MEGGKRSVKVQPTVTAAEEAGRERFGKARTTETASADKETGKERELHELAGTGRRKAVCVVRARQERTGILYTDQRLIKRPEDVLAAFGRLFDRAGVEQLYAVSLTKRGEPVAVQMIALGGVDSCMVSVAEIMKLTLLSNCPSFLLIHNHPSGSILPSEEDKAVTERVEKAAEIMGLQLMDHLIVGDLRNGYSMKYEKEVHPQGTDPEETGESGAAFPDTGSKEKGRGNERNCRNERDCGSRKACREKKGA